MGLTLRDEKVQNEGHDLIRQAINTIKETYNHNVSVDAKRKSLLKFGKNENVGTSEVMVEPSGTETYVSDNTIAYFSSSSGSDTGSMVVEYHTVDGNGDFTFGTQTVTLAGQTKTALTVPCARVSRIYNDSATNWVGVIYIYEDDTVTAGVPQTASKIHIQTTTGDNNSYKAATTFSSTDYAIITYFYADVNKKANANVDVELQVRQKGKVFRDVFARSCSNSMGVEMVLDPPIIVPPNADVRVMAESDTASTSVSAGFNGYLAKIISS